MKRLIFLGACWAGLLRVAWAQAPPTPSPDSTQRPQDISPIRLARNGLKLNLYGLRTGEFGVLFARRLTPETLLLGGLGPNFADGLFQRFHYSGHLHSPTRMRNLREEFRTGLWLRGEFRLYLLPDEFPAGPYMAAMVRYKRFGVRYQGEGYDNPNQQRDHTTSYQFFDYALLAGFDVELYQGFTLDVQMGFGNRTAVYSRLESLEMVGTNGRLVHPAEFSNYGNNYFMPYFSFMLGYYFH